MVFDRTSRIDRCWPSGQRERWKLCMSLLIMFGCARLTGSAQSNGPSPTADDVYELGVGIADITGPAADVGMMGYAKGDQETQGIHFRLYSRAFIVAKPNQGRIVYVNCDMAMISTAVKTEVVRQLRSGHGQTYTEDNIMISATHTHSGPGGFLQYVLYIISTQGFNRQNFFIIVTGIVRSIERAHKSMKKGRLWFAEGVLNHANINRSPSGYAANPESEKAKYEQNTDNVMQILRFEDTEGQPMGVITWFPVHCTSMNNTNKLISGDNKGYASLLYEQHMNPGYLPGKGAFVAAFANSNEGDVSPNIRGPRCLNTGMPCDMYTSTCPDLRYRSDTSTSHMQHDLPAKLSSNERCVAIGPGKDMFESTRIIGKMQYDKAKELMDSTSLHRKVSGPINYIHQYIDFSNQPIYNGKGQAYARTCPPAMGYSFAAGTTDGPGAFDFKQGATSSTPFWNLVRDFIRRPSPQLIQCQHPKPILLASGEMRFPYAWQPSVIPLQLISIGHVSPSPNETSLLLTALPAEFTTMAGRRVRNLLQSMLDSSSEETGVPSSYQSNILTTSRQIKNKHIQTAALKRSDAVDGKWKPIAMPARSVRSRRWDNQPVLRLSDRESIEPTNDVSNDVSEPPSNDLGVSSTLSSAAKPIVPAITIINADSDALISSPLKTGSSHKVILAGLANAYSSYVTTYEEYQRQRYEAASTLYGPYTLHAYLQNFRLLASWLQKLRTGQQLPQSRSDKATVQPPNLLNKQLQLKPGVVYDGTKIGTKFGDVVKDARPLYRTGDQVQVTYRSGHPQNWPAIENTYLTVEYLDASKQRWVVIATDANWETKYIWTRSNFVMGESISTVTWDIPFNVKAGTYRIRHFGASKSIFQKITSYVGTSSSFQVKA